MIITLPKILKANNIDDFLVSIKKIYPLIGTGTSDVKIDVSKIAKPNILSLLLIYKLIDFTYQKYCFTKPQLIVSDTIKEAWEQYGFKSLIDAYVSNKDITEKEYKKLKVRVEDNFIIAPQALLREDNFSRNFLKTEFLPKIKNYYCDSPKKIAVIFTCLSEILLNFWEHAVLDTKSILVAEGNKFNIEIACADSGEGIITNLSGIKDYSRLKKDELIRKAFEKGVTSKKNSNHMGYGLWIISELLKINRGRLFLYSEGAYYKNNFGNISSGITEHWQGTIIYLSIPLQKPQTLSDMNVGQGLSNLKINFN